MNTESKKVLVGEGVDIEVLRKIKGYIRDVRSEEERLEAEDKMPNMVI